MTAKGFFKSTAFKSLATLLVIVLVSGVLLAILNDLLYVTEEEKFNRTLSKIYGKSVQTTALELSDQDSAYPNGTVNGAYLVEDGNYLVQTTGKGGYPNGIGTVTLWTVFFCTGSKKDGDLVWTGIEKVVYESNEKQTYISNISQSVYDGFSDHDAEILAGKLFTTDSSSSDIYTPKSGASFSTAAICNAVNTAIEFFKAFVLEQAEEQTYLYEEYIEEVSVAVDAAENSVAYALKIKSNSPAQTFTIDITVTEGAVSAYEIVVNGSTAEKYVNNMPADVKDGSLFLGKTKEQILALLTEEGALSTDSGLLQTGATRSTESCVRAAAFAVANFEKILADGGLV